MRPHAKMTKWSICQELIGKYLGTNQNGHAGRELEKLLESMGVTINRGTGPDILVFGLEVKSRDRWAISAQTIADMNIRDIQACGYEDSHVRQKFQQQLRIYTENGYIVDAGIYDFSKPDIQELMCKAYEHARAQLIKDPTLVRTAYSGFFGYFERTKAGCESSYSFRLSPGDMAVLEGMALSTFTKLWEYV